MSHAQVALAALTLAFLAAACVLVGEADVMAWVAFVIAVLGFLSLAAMVTSDRRPP